MNFIKNFKDVNDSVHGIINLSDAACLIINTPEFQRLRYLKQLGTTYLVFPTAIHSRFEHSIGTYYLAGRALDNIKHNSDPKLINEYLDSIEELKNYYQKYKIVDKLDDWICELVKIAGLCHDMGHGPFSHVFDDWFIPEARMNTNKKISKYESHEARSCLILEMIIKNDKKLSEMIGDSELKFINKLIKPDNTCTNFIYQIISNNLNCIDVDKFDYISRDTRSIGLKYNIDHNRIINDMRVIDNKICYPEKVYYDIYSIFENRYRLHKQIYCHKSVISTQTMINKIMLLLDPILNIYDSIGNMNKFIDLTDDYIFTMTKYLYGTIKNYKEQEQINIKSAYDIYNRIMRREFYSLAGSFITDKSKTVDNQLILSKDQSIDIKNIFIAHIKIGFVSGKKHNPLDNIYLYKKKDPTVCFTINQNKISYLIPKKYQEHIYLIFMYDKNLELEAKIKKIIELIIA